jgi:hypothetical protein
MPRRLTFLLVWLALTAEIEGEIFAGKWSTPLTWLGTFLFTPSALKLPVWDFLVFGTLALAVARKGARRDRVRPVLTSMLVSLASLGALWVWGVARGGDVRQTTWQLHLFVMAFVVAHLVVASCRTVAHYTQLGKVILAAALYRAFILIVFRFTVAPTLVPWPQTMTTHSDTALFVVGIVLLVVDAVERRTGRSVLRAVALTIPIALAIHWNNRRLAWLSLGLSLALVYLLLPAGPVRRRINQAVTVLVPLAALYVIVGWERTERIFKPVRSIATMIGSQADASSETRDIENWNLIQTLKTSPLLGLGFGHEYHEYSVAYSIKEIFPQYRYIPHNSVLGLLAFTGLAGFTGTWQVFAVSAFFNARVLRVARTPEARAVGLASLVMLVAYMLQAWGDMGLSALTPGVLFAVSLAASVRMPVLVGDWPSSASKARIEVQDGEHPEDGKGHEGAEHASEPALRAAGPARVGDGDRERPDQDAQEDDLRHRPAPP